MRTNGNEEQTKRPLELPSTVAAVSEQNCSRGDSGAICIPRS